MLENLNSNLILAVFIWVSLTKTPFDLIKNAVLSNWLIRMWAVVSAMLFAYIDGHFSTNLVFAGPRAYFSLRDAAEAGIGAILAYHIGTGDFKGFFDSGTKTDPNTVTGVPVAKLQEVLQKDAQPMTPTKVTTRPELGSLDSSFGTTAAQLALQRVTTGGDLTTVAQVDNLRLKVDNAELKSTIAKLQKDLDKDQETLNLLKYDVDPPTPPAAVPDPSLTVPDSTPSADPSPGPDARHSAPGEAPDMPDTRPTSVV